MRRGGLIAALVLLCSGVPASAGAPAGLTVWPARVRLPVGMSTELHVANRTARPAVLGVRVAGLSFDLRGAPHVVPSSAGSSLVVVRPPRLVVPPGRTATLMLRAGPAKAGAGDRPALVLLTARSGGGAGVGVRVRIGVTVEVRLAGAVRRRLDLGALRVRGRRLVLVVRNSGNIEERISRSLLLGQVWQHGRLVAVLAPRPQDVLPRALALLRFQVPPGMRGRVHVVVVAPRAAGGGRSYAVVF